MASPKGPPENDHSAMIISVPPSPRRHHHPPYFSAATPTTGASRRIAIAVDLSDESAYAVKWAVQNYLRPGDAVILLHVASTGVLYGADWGSIDPAVAAAMAAVNEDSADEESQQKLERELDVFTAAKADDLAQPLVEAGTPFKIHIVKDHDLKERLCLEVERLGLSAMIMGSRGFGSARQRAHNRGRLGTVSDYCVRHCGCPVVVVRLPEENSDAAAAEGGKTNGDAGEAARSSPREVYHDASDKQFDNMKAS